MSGIDNTSLGQYLATRDAQRRKRAEQQLQALTKRERRLVREAAVMGFVRGSTFGQSLATARQYKGTDMETVLPEPQFPHDSDIVFEVLDACDTFPDLYPVISHL